MNKLSPGPVVIVPEKIIEDTELSSSAKVLFCILTQLSKKSGFCWAENRYLAERMNATSRTVQRLLSQLAGRGYVTVEVIRDTQTNEVLSRHIYCNEIPGR